MQLPTLAQIEEARSIVYRHMSPTPQYSWPLVNLRLSGSNGSSHHVEAPRVECWIKHENHTPVGAFNGALSSLPALAQCRAK